MRPIALELRQVQSYLGARPALLLVVLTGLYFGVHFVLRLLVTRSLQQDDADLVLFSQSLDWGYNLQGPLYSWLVWLAFHVCGMSIATLALVQALILGCLQVFLYLCARLVIRDTRLALLASFSLFAIPTFAWNSLAYITHTNLLCAICAATVYVFFRLLETRRSLYFVLLGCLLALGILTKYNYVVFAGSLFIAAWTVRECRQRLLDRRLLLTFALAALLVLPHFLWLADHWPLVSYLLAVRTGTMEAPDYWSGLAAAVAAFASSAFLIMTPLWLFWLFLFPEGFRATRRPTGVGIDFGCLLVRFFGVAAAWLLLQIAATGMSRFHERWLQPFALLAPIYFFVRLDPAILRLRRLQRYAWLLVICAVGVTIARASQLVFGGSEGGGYPMQASFARVVEEVKSAGFENGTILGGDNVLCGNLRLAFPHARVLCAKYPYYDVPPVTAEPCLVMWNPRYQGYQLPLPGWFMAPVCDDHTPVHCLDLPVSKSRIRSISLAFKVLPRVPDECPRLP